jgi:hypothetical protein
MLRPELAGCVPLGLGLAVLPLIPRPRTPELTGSAALRSQVNDPNGWYLARPKGSSSQRRRSLLAARCIAGRAHASTAVRSAPPPRNPADGVAVLSSLDFLQDRLCTRGNTTCERLWARKGRAQGRTTAARLRPQCRGRCPAAAPRLKLPCSRHCAACAARAQQHVCVKREAVGAGAPGRGPCFYPPSFHPASAAAGPGARPARPTALSPAAAPETHGVLLNFLNRHAAFTSTCQRAASGRLAWSGAMRSART